MPFVVISLILWLLTAPAANAGSGEKKRMVEMRLREVRDLKLTGVEEFIWRPILACSAAVAKKDLCLPVTMDFLPPGREPRESPESVMIAEEPLPACLICHRNHRDQRVVFHVSLKGLNSTAEREERSLFQWAMILLPLLPALFLPAFHFWLWRFRPPGFVAVAIVFRSAAGTTAGFSAGMRRSLLRKCLYAECGESYLRAWLPVKHLTRWSKMFFTAANGFPDRNVHPASGVFMRQLVSEGGDGFHLSFESLRMAQNFALRIPAGRLLVASDLKFNGAAEKLPGRALWKTSQGELVFHIYTIR